jgi:hypothetical protein
VLGTIADDEARTLDRAALACLPDLKIETPDVEQGNRRRKR